MEQKQSKKLRYVVKVGILSAMAGILMLIEIPLPFAPPFYKMDLSDFPVLIGGFALGPVAAVLMELIKNLIHIVIKGTSTAFIGELANFVTSTALVLPAALIYKYRKTLKGAFLGMGIGTLSIGVIGSLINYFILIPAFSRFYGLSLDAIVEMGTSVNASITDLKTLIVFATLPFNLLKGIVCSLVTLPVYKRVSGILHS